MGEFLLTNWLPIICVLVAAIVIWRLLGLLRRIEAWKWLMRQEWTYLELKLPRSNDKSVGATEQLFSVLHGLKWRGSGKDALLGRSIILSAEITAKRAEGIRFLMRVPQHVAGLVRQNITAFLPEIQVNETKEPEIGQDKYTQVAEFRQTGHFAYPLRQQEALSENDPMAYLTAAMSQLKEDEQITFQLILSPAPKSMTRGVERRVENLTGIQAIQNPALRLSLSFVAGVIGWVIDMIEFALSGSSYKSQHAKKNHEKTMAVTNQNETVEAARRKLNEPLFSVKIRALAAAENPKTANYRIQGTKTALAAFNAPRQAIKSKPGLQRFLRFAFAHRLPALTNSQANILSATELASIYHFPYSQTAKPENLLKSLSRTLPAPVSMKQPDNNFEIIIGENVHQGITTPLGLTRTDRERHMYVIGGTGNGKSTLLLYAIVQDILAGRGVGIIDPHGDLAEKILQYIPEERAKDVVYFNPDDIDYPPGLNLMEIDPAITGSDRLKMISKVTDAIVEAFRKAFSEDGTGGHRIESVLRNGILTAMTVEGATLFTIQKLLRNEEFRKEVAGKLTEQHLVDFWEELDKAGEMQRVSMTKGVTMKLDRLQLDPIVGRIFGQEKSTINFGEILDGKIFICNLSKKIGPDNSSLLGTIILSLLQIAAQARADTAEEDRKPFYLYVDEFQNFATKTFTDMVAEARKYRLFVTMAEQTTSQQDKEIAETILGNIGVLVSFRTGNPADERMLTPFYGGFLEPGEINNLSPFNYYVRLAASAQEPTSGRTIVLPPVDGQSIAQRVKDHSREAYARKYVEPPKPEKPAKKKAAPAPVTKPKRRRYRKQ